jgi:hypothetical protein
MTIGEITYKIMKRLGMSSDDFIFSEQMIFSDVKSARNELIQQEVEKGRLTDGSNTQILLLKFEESKLSPSEYSGVPFVVYESIDKVPKFIDSKNGPLLFGIYTGAGERIIPVKSINEYTTNLKRRTADKSRNNIRGLLRNNKLLIFGLDKFTLDFEVSVEGFYEDPEIVEMINRSDYKNGICPSMQSLEFNCPGYIERRVELIAYETSARRLGIKTDLENDGKPEITT